MRHCKSGEQMKFRVLSIDAWADCCGCEHEEENGPRCWTWNTWFTQDKEYDEEIHGTLNEANALKFFNSEYITPEYRDKFEISDDQYNLVLIDKTTLKPRLAIEYGNKL
jgi:hypothetical protein